MERLILTLPTVAENLALDEALLEEAETAETAQETLRLWEPAQTVVVVGRGSQIEQEVDLAACRQEGVPILRRSSGGGAIVTGPGCLMYAAVLSHQSRAELRSVDAAHRFVLQTLAQELARLAGGVARRGISDLALGELKFSGNSLRLKRTHLLYHGTLLYDFPLDTIGRYLTSPPREPDYRQGRSHAAFVTNLPLDRASLCEAVIRAWDAQTERSSWPQPRVAQLVAQKYAQDGWNLRH